MRLSSRLPLPAALSASLRARTASLTPLQIALALVLLVGAALGQVHLRLQVIEAGYALSRETRQHHDLADGNQKLRIELATRRDPALIERRARGELRMAPPDPAAIRSLRLPPDPALADRSAR